MHKGEDTEFYLSRGYSVVGVEANPHLVDFLQNKFRSELRNGRLTLVAKALSDRPGKIQFGIADKSSIWGTASNVFMKRNRELGIECDVVEVETIQFDELIQTWEIPYYVKIDIEGMDMLCIKGLLTAAHKPRFVSLESAVTSPIAAFDDAFDEIAHLWVIGYRHFKYVDQASLKKLNGMLLDKEGPVMRYEYREHSSGPFGEESPGGWLSAEAALRKMKSLITYQTMLGMGGRHHDKLLSKIGRRLRRHLKRLDSHSWYDLHARFG